MLDVKNIRWSWSRVNSFYMALIGKGCFLDWHKAYIQGMRGEGNWFASVGLVVHDVLEEYVRGDLSEWDVSDSFVEKFTNIKDKPLAQRMAQSYYNNLYNFFSGELFIDFFDKFSAFETEEERNFDVGGYNFVGFPDLAGEHSEYGLCLVDYKTAKPYEGEELEHNIKQLYLYSIPFMESYGDYPDNLIFMHPRHSELKVIPYEIEKLGETMKWCIETIEKIATWNDWKPRCEFNLKEVLSNLSDIEQIERMHGSFDEDMQKKLKDTFYQKQLCNHRFTCEHMK